MQTSTLIKVAALGLLTTMCTAAAYLEDDQTAGTDPRHRSQAAMQPQQPAPVIDLGSMFAAARR